jgi:NAD dependent epimerase/dehydratase family
MHSATGTPQPESRIFVAGRRGLVGSALLALLRISGIQNLIGCTSAELDLRDAGATDAAFFKQTRPDVVVVAAARVGGILANAGRPTQLISDNLRGFKSTYSTAPWPMVSTAFSYWVEFCIPPDSPGNRSARMHSYRTT